MKNGSGGGYAAYEYPQWSAILGWMIFVGCVIPIPLVYLINYIKEYRSITPKVVNNSVHESDDYAGQPRFLQAISENNSPRSDWGPKKRANHYGLYSHLSPRPASVSKGDFTNELFQDDRFQTRF